jgi:Flp pilus assembly protein TadD
VDQEALREEHNRLYVEAVELIRPDLRTNEHPEHELAADTVPRLEKAVGLLDRVLELNPPNWSAHWFRGKALQALERHEEALKSFVHALEWHRDPEMAREAGIAAMETGDFALGIGFCKMALEMAPRDHGLLANLGLGLLFDGRPVEARPAFLKSIEINPNDSLTIRLLHVTDEVLAGSRPCPHSPRDIEVEHQH